MKTNPVCFDSASSLLRKFAPVAASLSLIFSAGAQSLPWGLTIANINNPVEPVITRNPDGSLTITAGGGDTYDSPDSFTYAYQMVTGDFDVRVQVLSLEATDAQLQDSPKAALMVRAGLEPDSPNVQINALPLAPSGREGEIESIGRFIPGQGGQDIPGTADKWGGDTVNPGACTYPDLWLRIRRQGDRFITYYANTLKPQGTNGWNLLTTMAAGPNFPKTVYIGLSTVAHNSDPGSPNRVMATYANYGNTPAQASLPTSGGQPVDAGLMPGFLPRYSVVGVNWDISVSPDGLGYPGNILQSDQGESQRIIWNSGGFASVSRDVLASISSQSPGGFSAARYQCGALDFLLSPRDPQAAQEHLGPYTNPKRKRYSSGDPTVPASQAWFPTPEEGFVISTIRRNGQSWNDTAPAFHAATYIQMDGEASGKGYSPVTGAFGGMHFYTRTTKLVTGSPLDPASGTGSLQRCAVDLSIAYFPYQQGWKSGYFDSSSKGKNPTPPGIATFKAPFGGPLIGDGFGTFSGAAVSGIQEDKISNPASQLLTWLENTPGSADFSGLGVLDLPGVNSLTDGMLFTVSNDEGDSVRGNYVNNAPIQDGAGWQVAIRGIEESKADPALYTSSSFSFLYVPYDSVNLIGARIRGTTGSVIKGAGTFTLTRQSAGRYSLTIPGKTEADGMLILQNSGYHATQTNVVDTSFMSYEASGNSFIIEARAIDPAASAGAGEAVLRDSDFNFVWVDFHNPLSPPGTSLPVLSITRSGATVNVTWTGGGEGWTLQQATDPATPAGWTDLGTENPQAVNVTPGRKFFRLIRR